MRPNPMLPILMMGAKRGSTHERFFVVLHDRLKSEWMCIFGNASSSESREVPFTDFY